MKKTLKYLSIAAVGGISYNFLELVWRGVTHISMTVAGGICLVLIYIVNELFPRAPLMIRSLAGAVIITAVDFLSGYIVNIKMGLAVWNYSDRQFQFMGQICLLYSVLWFLLCIPLNLICKKLIAKP